MADASRHVPRVPSASTGLPEDSRPRPVLVVLMIYNRPDLLPHQVATFRRAVEPPVQIVIVNNAPDELKGTFRELAHTLGVASIDVENPRTDTANYSHARALEFTLAQIVVPTRALTVIADHDVFPLGPVALRELLEDSPLAGVEQGRDEDGRSVRYLHPALLLMDAERLPEVATLSLWPDVVDGVRCDVGGHVWQYLKAHGDLAVGLLRWFEGVGGDGDTIRDASPGTDLAPEEFHVEILGGRFLHYRAASDWDYRGAAHHAAKTACLLRILEDRWARAGERMPIEATIVRAVELTGGADVR